MNEKVTLNVFKDSPHIWRGGLTDVELAVWLVAKANALLYKNRAKKERQQKREELADAESVTQIIESYTNLGVSSSENDPIRQVSKEAIDHASMIASLVAAEGSPVGIPVLPAGYTLLPEMEEEVREIRQKKAELLELLKDRYGNISNNERHQDVLLLISQDPLSRIGRY